MIEFVAKVVPSWSCTSIPLRVPRSTDPRFSHYFFLAFHCAINCHVSRESRVFLKDLNSRLKNIRNRHNRVRTDVEPDIHTLQGGRRNRFKYRYKYRYNDPLQRSLVQSHRQVSKVASRRQSAPVRRGQEIKGFRQSASHEDTQHDLALQPERGQSRMSPKRQHQSPQGMLSDGSGSVLRLGRSVNDQTPTASEV